MLTVYCHCLPQKKALLSRQFLTMHNGKFCQTLKCWLQPEDDQEVVRLITQVIGGIDQRYCYNSTELMFNLFCHPSITTSVGADQLRDELLKQFSELHQINWGIRYVVGIYNDRSLDAVHMAQT